MRSLSIARPGLFPVCISILPGWKLTRSLLVGLVMILSSATATADIVINEIMQNPSAVSDSNGEWFELFNSGGSAVDINGWTFEDNDFDSFVVTNGGPLLVPAGGFVVLGNNATFATNGGVNVDYQFSGMALANGGDEFDDPGMFPGNPSNNGGLFSLLKRS